MEGDPDRFLDNLGRAGRNRIDKRLERRKVLQKKKQEMEETLIAIWGVLVVAFCIIGCARIIKDVRKAMNADEEIKRAIREGEIDNFDGKYGDPIERS